MDKVDALDKYSEEAVIANPNKYEGSPQSYREEVLDPLIKRLKNRENPVVLDLAAGKGTSADYLESHGIKTIRLDISRRKKDQGESQRIRALFDELPLKSGGIDVIHFKDAVVHSPDHRILFGEIFRILKPGGELLIVTAEENRPWPVFYVFPKQTSEVQRLPFLGEADYLEKAASMKSKPGMEDVEISAPYYPVTGLLLNIELKSAGFELKSQSDWLPKPSEKDWYSTPIKRIVISATKPQRKT